MFVGPGVLILNLPRTGTVHTGRALSAAGLGVADPPEAARHSGIADVPEDWHRSRRAAVTVRNPWRWHVSMYHFLHPGGPSERPEGFLGMLSAQLGRIPSFEEYVELACDPRSVPGADSVHWRWPSHTPFASLADWAGECRAGLMTLQMVHAASLRRWQLVRAARAPSAADLDAAPADVSLPETLETALRVPGVAAALRAWPVENESGVLRGLAYAGSHRDFYTRRTRALVWRAERAVVDAFDYRFSR